MYRWGLDLFGPFPETSRGFKYVLVCIEHFTKWVEAFPLRDKSSAEVSYHTLHGVLSRYGAPAEIVTDGGGEFQKEFDDLLFKFLVDHRHTSAHHPQANGAAERTVQTIKACLRRCVEDRGTRTDWDLYLPWVLMGYRITPQASTKLSPYYMLFGVQPIVPPSIKERLHVDVPLIFEDPEVAAGSVLERAKVLKHCSIIAGHNLHIAQHRDTLRYARLRSGGHVATIFTFQKGDFVWVKAANVRPDAIEPIARDSILKVVEVRPSGVLVLIGKCGTKSVVNAINCRKCHLAIQDAIAPPNPWTTDLYCQICTTANREQDMLLCDSCNMGYHYYCVGLNSLPSEPHWFCGPCLKAGVSKISGFTPLAQATRAKLTLLQPSVGQQARTLHRPPDKDERPLNTRKTARLADLS
jgi:hypothetical protein